jgi:hypothetical protein
MVRLAGLLAGVATVMVQSPTNVSVCELTSHAGRFDGEVVAVAGVLWRDGWFLFDPRCNSRDSWIAIEDDPAASFRLEDRVRAVDPRAVEGVFVGRASGPNGFGYSNLGTLRIQLIVTDARKLRPANVVAPATAAPAPRLEVKAAIEQLDEAWLRAAGAQDRSRLEGELADDYVAVLPSGRTILKNQAVRSLMLPHQEAMKAQPWRPGALEWRLRVFVMDSGMAVAIRDVELAQSPDGAAPKRWEYLNVYDLVGERWRLSLSRISSELGASPRWDEDLKAPQH